jgi:cytochrome oxidase Cu insertion factor (SCO1/SenC/PrrC family)
MRRTIGLLWLLVLALVLPQSSHQLWAQNDKDKKDAPPATTLKVGDEAPDFEMPDQAGAKVKLSSFRGKKNVALAFYIFAFTGG